MGLGNVKGKSGRIELCFSKDTTINEAQEEILELKKNRESFFSGEGVKFSYSGVDFTYSEEVLLSKKVKKEFKGSSLVLKHCLTDDEIQHSLLQTENICTVVKNTIRSGEKVVSRGDVLVYGDVNPGGEIVAKGNVTVIGSLRGTVKTDEGFVYAMSMQPTQIRIGKNISYNKNNENVGCAVAKAENGEIILERL